MDFFAAQDQARRRTRVLVVLFGLSILGIVLALYVPLNVIMGSRPGGHDLRLLLQVATPVSLFILGGAWWRLRSLRSGGATVAALMGARRVAPGTDAPDEQRLLNVVEEMALASGVPVPALFVMEQEEGINAFAAGYSIHDAAVVVTRGALDRLDREELQGVVAHEFSHIMNGDMRLNIRMMGVLYGLLLLTVVGRGVLRSAAYGGRRRGKEAGGALLLGVALVAVGYLGVFFGKLLKAAISREREYLADAAAVQFTRNPAGVAGALKKISMLYPGSVVQDHHAEELSHLFFASGLRDRWLSMPFFRTHPPLEERIRRIDTAWDGRYDVKVPEVMRERADAERADRVPGVGVPPMARMGLPTAAVIATMGAPAAVHLAYGRQRLDGIPPSLRDAAHDEAGAQALIFALLLTGRGAERQEGGGGDDVRERQLDLIATYGGADMVRGTIALAATVAGTGADARLAMVDLALPSLHALSEPRAVAFRRTAQWLVRADDRVDMFEYALVHILARHLRTVEPPGAGLGRRVHSFKPLREDAQLVLSAIAHSGARTVAEAEAAFAAAAERLPGPAHPLAIQPPGAIDLPRMDRAIQRLETAAPGVRRRFVDACAHCVAFDGRVLPAEAETLRAVAEALDCPLPPLSALPPIPASSPPRVPA
jgi:Zn-dependent protease with chaperone function